MNKKNIQKTIANLSDSDEEVPVTKHTKKDDKSKRKASAASDASSSVNLAKSKAKETKKPKKQVADSSDEDEVVEKKPVKKQPVKATKKKDDSDDESESEKPKKQAKPTKVAKKVESDDESESEKPKKEVKPRKASKNSKKVEESSDEDEKPKRKQSKNDKKAKKADSDDESEEAVGVPQKKVQQIEVVKNTEEEDDGETHAELFVKNLPYSVTEDSLYEHFAQFGNVLNVKVLKNKETGKPSGLGFVGFETRSEAKSAIANGGELDGRNLTLSFSNEKRDSKPFNNGANNGFKKQGQGFGRETPAYTGETHTIFVGNLGFKTNEVAIKKFFSKAGNIVGVRIAKHEDGKAKGFCHVDFDSQEAVQSAIALNGQNLDGRDLRIDASEPRKNRDGGGFRQGGFKSGGGFGGKKPGFAKPKHGEMGGAGKKKTFNDSDDE